MIRYTSYMNTSIIINKIRILRIYPPSFSVAILQRITYLRLYIAY